MQTTNAETPRRRLLLLLATLGLAILFASSLALMSNSKVSAVPGTDCTTLADYPHSARDSPGAIAAKGGERCNTIKNRIYTQASIHRSTWFGFEQVGQPESYEVYDGTSTYEPAPLRALYYCQGRTENDANSYRTHIYSNVEDTYGVRHVGDNYSPWITLWCG